MADEREIVMADPSIWIDLLDIAGTDGWVYDGDQFATVIYGNDPDRHGRNLDVLFEEGSRVYEDTMFTPWWRKCASCERPVERGMPDPCLGMLPGVRFACCGHGGPGGYIAFDNGTTIRFPRMTSDDVHGVVIG